MDSSVLPDGTGLDLPSGTMAESVMATQQIVLEDESTAASQLGVEPADVLGLLGPALYLPLLTANSIEGVLVVARKRGEETFDDQCVTTARALAAEAAVTLVLERAREDRHRLFLIEDRERIARDLHDLVIQRIFATGMHLQSAVDDPDRLQARAIDAVTALDETITVIRQAIFQLTQPDSSLAGELDRLIDRHRAIRRNHIEIEIRGDLECLPAEVRNQLIPTLNELLTNVERHADAQTATVMIAIEDHQLIMSVGDDGVGIDHEHKGSGFGIGNLTKRAEALGGRLRFEPGPGRNGTSVVWSVPLPEPTSSGHPALE
jgi:signal transduction histidine kinase